MIPTIMVPTSLQAHTDKCAFKLSSNRDIHKCTCGYTKWYLQFYNFCEKCNMQHRGPCR